MADEETIYCDEFTVRTSSGWVSEPVNLRLDVGHACALVGRAGAGKSLIFEALAGIHRPDIEARGSHALPRAALLPQDARLGALPTDRVWALVGLSGLGVRLQQATGARWPLSLSEDRARLLMERLRLDPDRLAELPFRDLSSTERRAILLCRLLLRKPKVLLFDGWDEMMDGPTRRAIASLLRERMKAGLSVIFTSRRYPLRDFPEAELAPLGPLTPEVVPVPLFQKSSLRGPHTHPLLELNRVTVARPRLGFIRPRPPAYPVDGASLFVRHGETLVLLGTTGSGKTTLLHTVAGLHASTRGTILVTNQDVTYARGRRARRLRRDVQLVFQDAPSALDGNRTVQAHLEEAMSLASAATSTPAEWLERLGLSPRFLRVRADQLSVSESQRVDLARSLIVAPRLVLFDAPEVSAADCDGGLIASVLRVEKSKGRAFLVATSDPEVARSLADRVAILHAGRVIELGSREEVLDHPGHPLTVALLGSGSIAPVNPTTPARGCPHTSLCERRVLPQCDEQEPMLAPLLDHPTEEQSPLPGEHRCACFHPVNR